MTKAMFQLKKLYWSVLSMRHVHSMPAVNVVTSNAHVFVLFCFFSALYNSCTLPREY